MSTRKDAGEQPKHDIIQKGQIKLEVHQIVEDLIEKAELIALQRN